MTKSKKITLVVVLSFVVVVALGVVFALHSTQILRAVGVTKPAPIFTFDQSRATGWWAADNYNSSDSTEPDTYEGTEPIEKLPVASMNVFKGKKGEYATACFVMLSYYDYKADVVQLKKDKENEVLASTSMKKIGEDTVSVNVLGAEKSVALTKYELVGPDAENAMKGMSYGWADTGNGYLSVSGVCPTAVELDDTLSAASAVSLEKQ